MPLRLSRVVLLATAIAAILVAAENTSVGTWKLNIAKSKFHPGPAPQTQTVSIAQDGQVSFHQVTGDGKTADWSYSIAPDGVPAQITGIPDASVIATRLDERTVEHVWKIGTSTMHGKAVVSKDGKTMTYTLAGINAKGQAVHDVDIYEKQ